MEILQMIQQFMIKSSRSAVLWLTGTTFLQGRDSSKDFERPGRRPTVRTEYKIEDFRTNHSQ